MSPTTRPVAVLLPDLTGGGAERSVLRTAGELAAAGVPVDVVLGSADGPLVSELPAGTDVFDLGRPHMRTAAVPLRRYLLARRPSHLVPTLEHAVAVADTAIRMARTDTVLVPRVANTLTQTEATAGRVDRIVHRLARRAYQRAPLVVAVSDGVRDDLITAHGLAPRKVRVVPNPVVGPEVLARASAPAAHPWFQDDGPPIVMGMGRLTAQKNFPLLVDAFASAVHDAPARLVILGEGELREELQARVDALGIADVVDLPGFVDDPFPLLGRAHVFVLSSNFEGLPGALIQATACGATPVATDCPSGPAEILQDGRYGHLVPMGDVETMRSAIVEALGRPRAGFGEQVWGRWTTDRARAAWLDVLGSAASVTDHVASMVRAS